MDFPQSTASPLEEIWPNTKHGRWMDATGTAGLVSVIVPTYNRAQFLPTALDSVYAQTYRPIELLVVDDGSTDDTQQVVETWSETHRNDQFTVRLLHQENSGAPAARNLGLIESTGAYIQFLDSDDALHPRKLDIQVAALETEPTAAFTWSEHGAFDVEAESPQHPSYNVDALLENGTFVPAIPIFGATGNVWTGLYRRDLCRRTGPWNETLIRWQDLEYNARCMAHHPAGRYIEADLVSMGNHSSGRIQDLGNTIRGVEGGMRSLAAIEKTLDHTPHPEPKARDTIATFYLNTATTAFRHGRSDLALASLDGTSRNSRSTAHSLKTSLLRGIHTLFGTKPAYVLMKAYSDVRLGLSRM
jgi:glycosyltransferase involved in cell wall biosynthesis